MRWCFVLGLALLLPQVAQARRVSSVEIADSLTAFANRYARVGEVEVEREWVRGGVLYIRANKNLSYMPFRPHNVHEIKRTLVQMHGGRYSDVVLVTDARRIEEYVPNWALTQDKHKNLYCLPECEHPLVENVSHPYRIMNGLAGKHVALWGSHGLYFEQKLNRWEWQRARLLQTVEDMYTSSFTMPFLVPMLENAGAVVVQPRERDVQCHEVIVDNDTEGNGRLRLDNGREDWAVSDSLGFAHEQEVYTEGQNPFRMGTYLMAESEEKDRRLSVAEYVPELPETDEYAVYVSYKTLPKSTENAHYVVHHAGGVTEYEVNQRMGGGTWVYLGTFLFDKDNADAAKVVLSNYTGKHGEVVTTDAVRFGGGMGNVARKPVKDVLPDSVTPCVFEYQLSGVPRYLEAARYWMQWAGIPDSIYNCTEGTNDYVDDFSSRGRWVNYLAGGSAANPEQEGLGIPFHLSLAFHSDAGVTPGDSIVGTLGIFTSHDNDKAEQYPTGVSRMNSRDFVDLVMTQIVADVRATMAVEWERRSLFDRSYAECRYPVVPSMILELLSHQNFADMRYGNDPQFKFVVSRAIYKAILKYLHLQYGSEYVVQPLPVQAFGIERAGVDSLCLSWRSREDALEPTAIPTHYVVYTRIDNGGYDNGKVCAASEMRMKIEQGRHYAFRVAALNAGGVSMKSEELAAYIAPDEKGTALVVNGFDRVAAPESFAVDTFYAGFVPNDNGVPYMHDVSYIGSQYNYDKLSQWVDDDAPGFGASDATYEHQLVAGNTFDYPLVHGRAIARCGYSYVSCSHAALDTANVRMDYDFVDVILGKQRRTVRGTECKQVAHDVFSPMMRGVLEAYTQGGVDVLVSGAYVGSDLWADTLATDEGRAWAERVLHYMHRTSDASRSGQVLAVTSPVSEFGRGGKYAFYTYPNEHKYQVYDPDGIEPSGERAYTQFRYSDSGVSAGVVYDGEGYKSSVLAFPLESLQNEDKIHDIIKRMVDFFE